MSPRGINFYTYQLEAVEKLRTGSILCGGVGSGKSIISLLYFYTKECNGFFKKDKITNTQNPKDLYIITTAKKRDSLEWERECAVFGLSKDKTASVDNIKVTIESWNNIHKYTKIENAFFIFDEQRLIGNGTWVKSFLKIAQKNNWILLTATPGDTWMDYIPVFIANGFYKNRSEFIRQHVIYNPFIKFPKVDRYIEVSKLNRLKNNITVLVDYVNPVVIKKEYIWVEYNKKDYNKVLLDRWNIFNNKPIFDASQLFFTIRKIVNSDYSRVKAIYQLLQKHQKLIVFYNFDYELEILRNFKEYTIVAEYNGHKHEKLPESESWVYLVQYIAGSEGWNCIETNALVFYSQNYSYRMMTQAAGRINRLNTPFHTLYYYTLISKSSIDLAIKKALNNKKKFNENDFSLALKTYTIMKRE